MTFGRSGGEVGLEAAERGECARDVAIEKGLGNKVQIKEFSAKGPAKLIAGNVI